MKMEEMQTWQNDDFPFRLLYCQMKGDISVHTHDFVEIVFFLHGTAIHNLMTPDHFSRKYTVFQGDLFFIRPGEYHSYENGRNSSFYNLIFSKELLQTIIGDLNNLPNWKLFWEESTGILHHKIHLNINERAKCNAWFEEIKQEMTLKRDGYQLYCQAILHQILIFAMRKNVLALPSHISLFCNNHLLSIINEMENHPEKSFTLKMLSQKANMCVSGFSRSFRLITGLAPMQYLLTVRIEKAVFLLCHTKMSLTDIASKCNFSSVNYLIKVFNQKYHISPNKYRSLYAGIKEKSNCM